jgi:pantoate kinase
MVEHDEISKAEKSLGEKLRQPTPEQFYSDIGQVTAGLLEVLGLTLSQVKTMDYVERARKLASHARMLGDMVDQLVEEWQREEEPDKERPT